MEICIENTSNLTAFSWEKPLSVPLGVEKILKYLILLLLLAFFEAIHQHRKAKGKKMQHFILCNFLCIATMHLNSIISFPDIIDRYQLLLFFEVPILTTFMTLC